MTKNSPYVYWIIIGLLLLATSLSFLDRQSLSICIIKIKEDLRITDIDYGYINSGFLVSYAIMFTLGGILIDKYGSRLGLAFSVGFWSFATLLHSLATSVSYFGIFRFMLGVGEGGCFPGAIKAVTEWVPQRRHALANGVAIGGSAIGAVVAPPLSVYLLGVVGWRGVFLVTGSFGFLWLIAWLYFSRKSREQLIQHEEKQATKKKISEKIPLKVLLKDKEVRTIIIIRFLLDPIFYFYMFWIPKYLNETHSLSLESIGKILWIPFLALGLANVFGGMISDFIFQKTSKLDMARKSVMGIAAVLTIPVAFAGIIHSHVLIIVFMSVAFFAHGLWITNYITTISDIFGEQATSTVVGLSGSAGALSSLILNPVVGYIVAYFSYSPLWCYSGIMYSVAFILFVRFIPVIKSQMAVRAGV